MSNRNLVQHHGNVREQLNAAVPMGLVRDGKLSAMAKAVALEIWSHAEGRHQSTYSVAEALRINRRTAAAAIAELQEQRWLLREIHHVEGKKKPSWERWHLQMTNTPFSEDQCTQYTGTSAPSALPPVHPVHYIEVKGEVHEKCTSTSRSEGEAVHQMHCLPGDDDPQGESEPDRRSVSSSPGATEGEASARTDADPRQGGHSGVRHSTTHRRGATDPFASLPSGNSAQGESVPGDPWSVNPNERGGGGMLRLPQPVTAVSDDPRPWTQVWPKSKPWPPEPGTFDPFAPADPEAAKPLPV